MAMHHLRCGVQQYEWGSLGSGSLVARLGASGGHIKAVDEARPYAELWMGTHPSLPSVVRDTAQPLTELINSATVEPQFLRQYGSALPYLIKVLSVRKALSIQAHPDKTRARTLHERDPKNYPDANHKPELAVALTEFKAMCGFRRLAQIRSAFALFPLLRAAVPAWDDSASAAMDKAIGTDEGHVDPAQARAVLQPLLASLYAVPAEEMARLVAAQLELLDTQDAAAQTEAERHCPGARGAFVQAATQFPGDVGAWMVYFLNVLTLQPGQGLFLAANEPHAYMHGDCVEIMAASDNVVRAGLTPKFKDVPTLLDMLTYRQDAVEAGFFEAPRPGVPVTSYVPPEEYEEFRLEGVSLAEGEVVTLPLQSFSLAVVVSGAAELECEATGVDPLLAPTGVLTTQTQVQAGDVVAVPQPESSTLTIRASTPLTLFVASARSAFIGCPQPTEKRISPNTAR
jgi:mannose-6-phosphate isomerase